MKAIKLNEVQLPYIIILLLVLFLFGCNHHEKSPVEKNKLLITNMIEQGINNQNLEIFNKLLSPDYIRHSQSMPPGLEELTGIETYKGFIKGHLNAFPDYKEEIVQIIAEGNKVFIITKGFGTNTGPLGDIDPTNKEMTIMNYGLFKIENDKIVEIWVSWDNVAMLRQLGLYLN